MSTAKVNKSPLSTTVLVNDRCVLKCKNVTQLFDFPEKMIMRNVWLFRFGLDLDKSYPKLQACDKHFSSKMFNNEKLKSYAVPDLNLPVEITVDGTIDITKTKAPQKVGYTGNQAKTGTNAIRAPIKKTTPVVAPKMPVPTQKSAPAVRAVEPQSATINPWINDTSNLLVDYQLKVRGKNLCDVIEIPQYIVVFTVVRDKQKIKLSENKNKIAQTAVKRIANVKEPQSTEIITIDDDDEANAKQPEPPKMWRVHPTRSSTILNVIEPKAVSTPSEEPPAILKSMPVTPISPKVSEPIIPKVVPEPEPLCEIVYYTTEDIPPRRDRAIQVGSGGKQTSGVQCDFQLDYDLMQIQSNAKMIASQCTMEECLICGEILDSFASKIKHSREHEQISSLCWQCGVMFDSPMSLRVHTMNVHSNNLSSRKLHRCPKRKCKKAFLSKVLLDNHIQEHMQSRGNKCAKCLQVFNSPLKLICHQRALDKCLRNRGWTSKRWIKR